MQKQAHTCARDPITGWHTGRHTGLLPSGLGQAARRSAMRVAQERGCFVPVPRKREACVWTAGGCVCVCVCVLARRNEVEWSTVLLGSCFIEDVCIFLCVCMCRKIVWNGGKGNACLFN